MSVSATHPGSGAIGAPAPHKPALRSLALAALGVVYGDIGTSPLYTLSVTLAATGHAVPTASDVLGIVSLIFWALMAMVSLKYAYPRNASVKRTDSSATCLQRNAESASHQ